MCGTLAISRAWSVGPIIKILSRVVYPQRLRLFLPRLRPQVSMLIMLDKTILARGDERMLVRGYVSSKYWIEKELYFFDSSSHYKTIDFEKKDTNEIAKHTYAG